MTTCQPMGFPLHPGRSIVPVGKRSTAEKALVSSKAVMVTNTEHSVQRLHSEGE